MPDELFTAPPHWQWWGVLHFFVGGIAGGSFFLAALMDLLGSREDVRLARIGYPIAFPLIALGSIFLIVDLKQPQRFWHMLVQSETFLPMFKWWSPISYGTYIISAFSLFAFVALLAALVRPGDTPQRGPLKPIHKLVYGLGPFSALFRILGALLGLWLASYTGVLLSVTNRPVWATSSLISLLFVISGVSTAAAAIVLLAMLRRGASRDSLHALVRMDDWLLILDLIVLLGFVVSLGSLWGAMGIGWNSVWGLLLLLVVVVGLLMPLAMTLRRRVGDTRTMGLAAALVLVGGFVLRTVVVFSSELAGHAG